ncbi:MAG TPA: hypothetical protein VGM06_10230 [Polyangiaceae bacterium]|jgi:hypothetical protein
MRLLVRRLALSGALALAPVQASAQSSSAPGPAPADSTSAAPAPSTAAADADAAPSSSAAPKPSYPATGFSYGATSAQRPDRPRARTTTGPLPGTGAMMPGFETLPDGSTQLFVALTKPATFDTKSSPSQVTVVLKDVRVDRRNNLNPLITALFNTPVATARLVPHGRDVWFVVDLRANVTPAVSMGGGDTGKDGSSVLRVAFPKGDYLAVAPPRTPNAKKRAAAPAQASASVDAP